ncbi:MAG TPA: NADH-quinone oxidoreductase subunit K, partial [Candidatus Kapabacteria bacterium]|nr:NADH-quinone oxidoreductase subunit K [Candidatus Kapabacteria bacterium]
MSIGLNHYLVISALLFVLGMYAMLSRRNVIAVLMGVELIL